MKLKKGDTVKVLSGNDKGKSGEILEVMPKKNKVIVKDVNIKKRATKPRKAGEEGGITTGIERNFALAPRRLFERAKRKNSKNGMKNLPKSSCILIGSVVS